MKRGPDSERANDGARRRLDEARRLLSAGRGAEAEALIQQVLAKNPRDAMALTALGVVAAETGRAEDAKRRLTQALDIQADNLPALSWLGILLFREGKFFEARRRAREAVRLDPNNASMLALWARSSASLGEPADALEPYERAARLVPRDAGLLYDHAAALVACGREREAVATLRSAIRLHPTSFGRLNLANLLLGLKDLPEAEQLCRDVLAAEPDNAQAHGLLARILQEDSRSEQAEAHWEHAVRLDTGSGSLRFQRGMALVAAGRFSEAVDAFNSSIAQQPIQGGSYQGIVFNKRVGEDDMPLVRQMERVLEESALSPGDRVSLLYALGKSYDNLEDVGRAIGYFDEANRLRAAMASKPFDPAALERAISERIQTFTPELIAQASSIGIESDLPLLVVGMMRSGTTLLEQMLSCHGLVGGAGEQRYWGDHESSMVDFASRRVRRAELRLCAEKYAELLSSIAPGFPRVVDKNPANLQGLGSFHLAFPNGRMVHMRRHPVDVALSIWATPMNTTAPFAHDRSAIVFAAQQYERLRAHWVHVLPADRYKEVRYEDLVKDPESEMRTILDFCGLPWDAACLHPETNAKRIDTPSKWQARQPLYKSSLARWKRYEPWLGEFAKLMPQS